VLASRQDGWYGTSSIRREYLSANVYFDRDTLVLDTSKAKNVTFEVRQAGGPAAQGSLLLTTTSEHDLWHKLLLLAATSELALSLNRFHCRSPGPTVCSMPCSKVKPVPASQPTDQPSGR
jgi:hypothetical protein